MSSPIFSWAFELASMKLSEENPVRWDHVQGVARRVWSAAPALVGDNVDLVAAAAILHDIGYSRSLAITRFHPLDGALYLQKLGADKRLVALVAHHSCAYREAELRGLSGQLAEWTDEMSPSRDVLWWADITTTPHGEVTDVQSRIEEIEKRYGSEDLVTFFIRQAKPELVAAVERTEERLRAAGIDYTAK